MFFIDENSNHATQSAPMVHINEFNAETKLNIGGVGSFSPNVNSSVRQEEFYSIGLRSSKEKQKKPKRKFAKQNSMKCVHFYCIIWNIWQILQFSMKYEQWTTIGIYASPFLNILFYIIKKLEFKCTHS